MTQHFPLSETTTLGALLARKITRQEAEALVAALIDGLDLLDAPDTDLEAEEDADATADDPRGEAVNEDGDTLDDGEEDRSDYEQDHDDEPSLASCQDLDQRGWSRGDDADRELVNEDGGDILDDGEDVEACPYEAAAQDAARRRNAELMASLPAVSPDLLARIAEDGTLYAMLLVGNCMEPLIPEGTKAVMDPKAKVKAGDLVCFYHRAPQGIVCKVKRLAANLMPGLKLPVKRTANTEILPVLIYETINPPQTFGLECDHVLAVHKIVGTLTAKGTLNRGLVRRNRAHLKRAGQIAH